MKNYLHQRSKSLLAFAVGFTILSSSVAGEVYAAECFYYGSDLANNATTTWDDETSTATLHADRNINRAFSYSYNFGSQSHTEGQFVSLAGYNPYTVAGATGNEKLTLYGDIMSVMDNNVTVKNLDTL